MPSTETSIFTRGKTWSRRAADAPPTPQHKWNTANRQKLRAHAIVRQTLRTGELKRGKCQCGSLRTEAHHPDYSQPLLVKWMCRACHQRHHGEQRRGGK